MSLDSKKCPSYVGKGLFDVGETDVVKIDELPDDPEVLKNIIRETAAQLDEAMHFKLPGQKLVPVEILKQHGRHTDTIMSLEVWNLLQNGERVVIIIEDGSQTVVAHAATEEECLAQLTAFQERWKQEKGESAPLCGLLSPPYGDAPGSENDAIPASRGRGNVWS